jgi:hypothetical protein
MVDNSAQFKDKINIKLIMDNDTIDLKTIIDNISVREIKENGTLGPQEIKYIKDILGEWNE